MRLLLFRKIVVNLFVMSQHNDEEFHKIISKFRIYMKTRSRIIMNDKITRAIVCRIFMPRAKKRHLITSDSINSNKDVSRLFVGIVVAFFMGNENGHYKGQPKGAISKTCWLDDSL